MITKTFTCILCYNLRTEKRTSRGNTLQRTKCKACKNISTKIATKVKYTYWSSAQAKKLYKQYLLPVIGNVQSN